MNYIMTVLGKTGHVVFCPRKTGSYSIARSWSSLVFPVLHTHNLYHFVVFDERNSSFHEFVSEHFDVVLSRDLVGDEKQVQYTIEVREEVKIRFLFLFFDSLKFVTSVRDPLARRVSQFLQSVTIEQVNAVMDSVYPECKRLKLQRPDVAQLCHFRKKMSRGSSCPIVLDALDMVLAGFHLLTEHEICILFKKHFIDKPIDEFTEFFSYMQDYTTPDFDLCKVANLGHDLQTYSFCGVKASHILVKLENLRDPAVKSALRSFTGIKQLGREHNSELSHHLFSYPVKAVKEFLLEHHRTSSLSPIRSTESQIASGFGY